MNAPRVTVIIPTYNREQDLPGAIASVLAQSVPVTEILVIDDGSSDQTPDVVASLPQPVRGLRQENAGVSAARNLGLAEATGDVIAFLDVDDRWAPEKLEMQLASLRAAPDAGWSLTSIRAVDPEGRPRSGHRGLQDAVPVFGDLGRRPESWFSTALTPLQVGPGAAIHPAFHGDLFPLLLHGNFVFPSTALIRTELARRVGPFNHRLRRAEDADYFLRVAAESRATVLLRPLVDYRTGSEDALTHRSHTIELIDTALECLRSAAERRGSLTHEEAEAYRTGRALLHRRRAWVEITNLAGPSARDSLRQLRAEGHRRTLRDLGLEILARCPTSVLMQLGRLKRAIR